MKTRISLQLVAVWFRSVQNLDSGLWTLDSIMDWVFVGCRICYSLVI